MDNIAIVILNTKINEKAFKHFYKPNISIICADGGANRLYTFDKSIIPATVIGDFDSILPDVKDYYIGKNSQIIQENDQDTSDFEKALLFLQDKQKIDYIFVFGGLQERFDQTINSLHTLARFKVKGSIISDYSILRFYTAGKHLFKFSEAEQRKGISLFPVKGEARISTKGLKWNLVQTQPISLGIFISTSNEAEQDEIEMESIDEFFFVTQLMDEYVD